jgi:hypothetical protein
VRTASLGFGGFVFFRTQGIARRDHASARAVRYVEKQSLRCSSRTILQLPVLVIDILRGKRDDTPAPWTTVDCEIDLHSGGIFRTVMRSPEGQTFPNIGRYLEVVENERLVWTNAVAPGVHKHLEQRTHISSNESRKLIFKRTKLCGPKGDILSTNKAMVDAERIGLEIQ